MMLDSSKDSKKEKANTPLSLVSESPRPMPKDSELKLGTLSSPDASNTGKFSTRIVFGMFHTIDRFLILHRNDC